LGLFALVAGETVAGRGKMYCFAENVLLHGWHKSCIEIATDF
jgi:hypothetical protein